MSEASLKKPMVTVECWWCDEFQQRGPKKTGYCMQAMKPTWPSVYKACREEARAEAGDFCWFCCPFADENEGYLCGEEHPGITDIHRCPEFTSHLNRALGGQNEHTFYYVQNCEVWRCDISIMWGVDHWKQDDLTRDWQWLAGWRRYYPEEMITNV